jgi:L-seryl-tRNA(Ser) seleniumtransferase
MPEDAMPPDADPFRARLRSLPRVDDLLRLPAVEAALGGHPRAVVVEAVRDTLAEVRGRLLAGEPAESSAEAVAAAAMERLRRREAEDRPGLGKVLNGTGILLHTNMGRAPLAEEAIEAVRAVAEGYCNLELDLSDGRRGDRTGAVEELLRSLTGAEAAAVANNCAAATMLLLESLGRGREVIVSRGQLVEIGGSYRLPEVFEKSGCVLREVGTTNRTRIADFERAITDRTAAVMRVHTGNFAVVGFAEQPTLAELADLARRRGVRLIDDAGSGLLNRDLPTGPAAKAAEREPAVAESVAAGADAVCFSGDKLLGGPQAGLIVGRADVVAAVKANPLMRAVRADKLALAALEATLRLHRDPETARRRIPFWRMATEPEPAVRDRAEALARLMKDACPGLDFVMTESFAHAGGGSLPTERIPSWAVAVDPSPIGCDAFAAALRSLPVPLIGRIHRGRIVLDVRTLAPAELPSVAAALSAARTALAGVG